MDPKEQLAIMAALAGTTDFEPETEGTVGSSKSRMSKKEWKRRQKRKKMARKSKQRNRKK